MNTSWAGGRESSYHFPVNNVSMMWDLAQYITSVRKKAQRWGRPSGSALLRRALSLTHHLGFMSAVPAVTLHVIWPSQFIHPLICSITAQRTCHTSNGFQSWLQGRGRDSRRERERERERDREREKNGRDCAYLVYKSTCDLARMTNSALVLPKRANQYPASQGGRGDGYNSAVAWR